MSSNRWSGWPESDVESDDDLSERSSDDLDSTSEDEVPFEPVFLITILFTLHRATMEIIVKFNKTSHTNHLFVLIWLIENFHLLNNPDNARLLMLLEDALAEHNEVSESLAESVLMTLCGLPINEPIQERVLLRLVSATKSVGYQSELRERRYYQAAAVAGNNKLLSAFQRVGFFSSNASNRVGEMLTKFVARGDKDKSAAYLETLVLVTEYKLKNKLTFIRNKIKTFEFVIHNNGGVLVDEISHKVPAHAATVFNFLGAVLEERWVLIERYPEIVERVTKELSEQDSKEKSWFSTAWILPSGVRDSSTTAFYQEILDVLAEGLRALENLQELKNVTRTRFLCTD